MGRITGSPSRARRRALSGRAALPLAAALLASCSPGEGRDQAPVLTLDPSSALQGAILVVNISAEGVRFEDCSNLADPASAVDAVTFSPPAGTGGITVYVVRPISAFVLRTEIAVDAGAAPGDYAVRVTCDGAAPLEGTFEVRERKDDPALALSPPAAAAGATNLPIEFEIDGGEFVPGASHVVFGTGSHVTVEDQVWESATEMTVTVDIDSDAPIGPMEVTVTTAGMVARGSFTVEERIYPAILALPDFVYRPAGGDPSIQATLTVVGSGVHFAAPDEEQDDPGTQVAFPENPGIAVTATVVNSPDTLTVNILVDALAILGPTPLTVTTGDEIAVTDFTVLVTPDTPVLTIYPSHLVRGAEASLLLAKAVNFAFEEPLQVAFAEPGCEVEGFEVLPSTGPSQAMAIDARADAGFAPDGNVLVVTSGTQAVAVHVAVRDPDATALATPEPSAFVQGTTGFAVLTFQEDGSFSPAATASVLGRSGLHIAYQSPAVDGSSLTLQLQVAPDAPLGPGLVRVADGDAVRETFVEIEPSGLVPAVTLSPQLVLPGRRTVVLEIDGAGLDFSSGPAAVSFDDPALRASSIQVVDQDRLSVMVEVAPTARGDVAVAYVADGSGSRAAATLREIPATAGAATAEPDEVVRGIEGDQLVEVTSPDGGFGATVAQVLDGIGVEVERVTVLSPSQLELALEVEPDGPGGWIGVLLETGARQVVVPLHIAGDDESLTLELAPGEIEPGTVAAPVIVAAPAGSSTLDAIFTAAVAGGEGTFASVDEILDGHQARILLDVPYDFAQEPGGLPVLVTATKGAYAGFLDVPPLLTGTAGEDAAWQGTLVAGESRLLAVDPGTAPAAVSPGIGIPALADIGAALVDGEGLIAVAAAPPERQLWIAAGTAAVAVTPSGDPGGAASRLTVRSYGALAVELAEPDDTPLLALPVGDPCAAAVLVSGAIGHGLDVDRIELPHASCELAAVVVARSLADRPWDTPDCWLERRGAAGDALLARDTGKPVADPRLYLASAGEGEQLVVGGELGSAGSYLLNLRRAAVIGELCLAADGPFIELSVPPGVSLDSLTVELLDGDDGTVVESLGLAGQTAGASGTFVIGGAAAVFADLIHAVAELPDAGAFAVRLRQGAAILDAVQIDGDGTYGEGEPLDRADGTCFRRPGTIDTDANGADFLPAWSGTPGEE